MLLRLFGKRRGNASSAAHQAPPNTIPRDADRGSALQKSTVLEMRQHYRRELDLERFPNDLTRMLFLASLRDCNSGRYLHPQLSQQMGTEAADTVLSACHNEVFRRLLLTPISEYVVQLEEYIRYARADRNLVLKAWESLQAYRATIPLIAKPIYSEFFCLNVEFALTVLRGSWLPGSSAVQAL